MFPKWRKNVKYVYKEIRFWSMFRLILLVWIETDGTKSYAIISSNSPRKLCNNFSSLSEFVTPKQLTPVLCCACYDSIPQLPHLPQSIKITCKGICCLINSIWREFCRRQHRWTQMKTIRVDHTYAGSQESRVFRLTVLQKLIPKFKAECNSLQIRLQSEEGITKCFSKRSPSV